MREQPFALLSPRSALPGGPSGPGATGAACRLAGSPACAPHLLLLHGAGTAAARAVLGGDPCASRPTAPADCCAAARPPPAERAAILSSGTCAPTTTRCSCIRTKCPRPGCRSPAAGTSAVASPIPQATGAAGADWRTHCCALATRRRLPRRSCPGCAGLSPYAHVVCSTPESSLRQPRRPAVRRRTRPSADRPGLSYSCCSSVTWPPAPSTKSSASPRRCAVAAAPPGFSATVLCTVCGPCCQ